MPPCPVPGTAYLTPCNTSYSCTVGIGDLSSCCVQFPFGQGTVNCGEDFRQSSPLREPRPLRLCGCDVMWCSLRRSPVPVFTTGESSGVTFTNNLSFSQNYAVVMLATQIRDTRSCSQRTCLKSHAHVIGRPLTPVPRPCDAFVSALSAGHGVTGRSNLLPAGPVMCVSPGSAARVRAL